MGVVYLALDTKLEKHVAIKCWIRERPGLSEAAGQRGAARGEAVAPQHRDGVRAVRRGPGPLRRLGVRCGPVPARGTLVQAPRVRAPVEVVHRHRARPGGGAHQGDHPSRSQAGQHPADRRRRPKIVDFGLAKSTRAIIASTRMVVSAVDSGTGAGTPAYMAPEQVDTRPGPLDFRCDLFAFGVTLYEAATGINPFAGARYGPRSTTSGAWSRPARATRYRPRSPRRDRAAAPSQGSARAVRVDEGPRARTGGVVRSQPAPSRPRRRILHHPSPRLGHGRGGRSTNSR